VCNTVRGWRLRPWYLPIAKGPPINNAGENEEHSPATARRPRSTTPQPRPRRGPPPLRESDRPTLPALQVLPAEQALARTRTDRQRPAVLDPSALPRQRPRPPANRPPCATGYCTSWGPGPVSVEFEVPAPAGADEAGGATWPPHSHDYAPPGQPDQPRNPLHKRLSERPADRQLSLRHPLTSTQRRSTSRVLHQLDFNVSDRGCLSIVCCFSLISR
jgi:hypothetical protein